MKNVTFLGVTVLVNTFAATASQSSDLPYLRRAVTKSSVRATSQNLRNSSMFATDYEMGILQERFMRTKLSKRKIVSAIYKF